MFSPDVPSHTHSLRPKRTRNAAGADDSIKPPQAKRKRSALRRDTFEPLAEASLNEIAGREKTEAKTNGHTVEEKPITSQPTIESKELTLRGGKKADKRSERGPGALILSNNDFYTVSQLPALPEQIRNRPQVPYSCLLSPEYGYALALTHTDALIWPYNSSATTPSSRDVTSFKLPFPPPSASDPLPLATFTARSVSGEPGIVAVSPKWGKIVYWETITNASSFVPGQTSSGVQGSVPGMFSRETIQEVVNAEPAGFILTFSHGRLAHLTVRDQIGRPAVGVQFLRKSAAASGTGLFGSIRNAFGGDRRRGTPIVKAGNSTKGQRDVVVVTEDAELEIWSTNIGVGNSLTTTLSFKDDLLEALKHQLPVDATAQPLHFKVLDIELGHGNGVTTELVKHGHATAFSFCLLVSLSLGKKAAYYIIEMTATTTDVQIKVVHSIKCYSSPLAESHSWRPRLSRFKSQPMAFVIFENAMVLFSLAKIKESPSSQLLMEKHALPDPFQDCIRFQENSIYRVLGFAAEEHDRRASCALAVQAFGMVRVVSHPRDADEVDVDDFEDRISAKSKIEQSVFFGTIKQNPLDLDGTSDQAFSAEEVEAAALEISAEILSSSSKHLPKTTPSIEMQMKLRAKALDDLVQHLLRIYPSSISRNTRFRLLWNAEKLAAAKAIWKVQEEIQRQYPLSDREMTYLEFSLRALHESRQKYPNPRKGEKDHVRHWLLNSVAKTDHLLSELVSCVPELAPMDVTNPKVVGDYLREAVDLWNAAYTAAFKFREDNAPVYGLGDEVFQDGVLLAGFPESLPHPWTSTPEPYQFGQRLIYDVCTFLNEWWDFNAASSKGKKKKIPTDLDGKPYEAAPKQVLDELAARLPVEVELFSRICTEENIQAQCQVKAREKDPEAQRKAVAEIKSEKRPRLTKAVDAMARFNMPGAIQLAEQWKDPGLLVSLNAEYLRLLVLDSAQHPDHAPKNEQTIAEVQDHAETYFDRFGQGWAYAHFSRKIEMGELGSLLSEAQLSDEHKQSHLTWFLKKGQKTGQQVGKISWINDVVGEGNYSRAQKTLSHVADDEETDLWSKKIELSLAKLAVLATAEGDKEKSASHTQPAQPVASVRAYSNKIELIDIQERLSDHINMAVGAAIDQKAAEDLAIQLFASRVVAKQPALKRLLKSALQAVLAAQPLSVEALVDILTLGDPVEWAGEPNDDPGVVGNECALALKAVELSDLPAFDQDSLRCTIWRRAMIRDDWIVLNETGGKDDRRVEEEMQQSSLFRTLAKVFLAAEEAGLTEVHLVSPAQILETDPFPSNLQDRFDDTEVESVRKDLEKEQAKLKSFVEKAQLEMHYEGLVTSAERLVRNLADAQGEEMAEAILEKEAPAVNGA